MEDGIRIGAAATALGVSIDTLRRWERSGRVTFERRGQPRHVVKESARNRFTGLVTKVTRDGVMAQVDIACGPNRVVSVMSREAADQLGLKPGDSATAVIKATTVVVERA